MSIKKSLPVLLIISVSLSFMACHREAAVTEEIQMTEGSNPILLAIDEESIDNGNEPNGFSDADVNDQLAEVGQRKTLDYFQKNNGKIIDLFTGQVGDEGWHALKTIPSSWISAGPSAKGSINYLEAGPGLGSGNPDDDKEVLLDRIPDVTPLRATGLTMLIGKTVIAVVYDSEISINYSPLQGNLMGATLGIIAFDVISVKERTDASTSSLPRVTIRIRDVNEVSGNALQLFSNAPVPRSSSEPFDIKPTTSVTTIELVAAP